MDVYCTQLARRVLVCYFSPGTGWVLASLHMLLDYVGERGMEASWTNTKKELTIMHAAQDHEADLGLSQAFLDSIRIQLHVIRASNTKAFMSMLDHLSETNFYSVSVPLHIHLETEHPEHLMRFVSDFTWPHGLKKVHVHRIGGTTDSIILRSWPLFSNNDMGLILADNSYPSMDFFRLVLSSIYWLQINSYNDSKLAGIGLSPYPLQQFGRGHVEDFVCMFGRQYESSSIGPLRAQLLPLSSVLYFQTFLQGLGFYSSLHVSSNKDRSKSLSVNPHVLPYMSDFENFMLELVQSRGYYLFYPQGHLMEPNTRIRVRESCKHNCTISEKFQSDGRGFGTAAAGLKQRQTSLFNLSLWDLPFLDTLGEPWGTWDATSRHLHDACEKQPGLLDVKCSDRVRLKPCEEAHLFTNEEISNVAGYTIILSHFWKASRSALIAPLLEHYANAPSVDKIFVVWHNQNVPCPGTSAIKSVPIIFVPQECDSLNNRFLIDKRVNTECVFVLDDDIQVHIEDLERLFYVWQAFPRRLVGFFPRWFQPKTQYSGKYLITSHGKANPSEGYSFVLTKAVMFSQAYLYEYRCGIGRKLHTVVDDMVNSEDLGLNLMVFSLLSKLPALAVKPLWPILDYGVERSNENSGLFNRGRQHFSNRSRSLTFFMEAYSISSDQLCCERMVADVTHGHDSVQLYMIPAHDLGKYVHYPCLYARRPGHCSFVSFAQVGKLNATTLPLQ
eukprot:CAMPEP_0183826618 /NCGR_PEP_ID=MMETSP0807_2-20130328/1792_1 /TAXON_ID=88271 /ORGANISM="Picocystis salinarum, Strain CCMP1897" /LENGTH=726 /DNA_ID=CAMNT_0026071741 /DNA_START=352 /DNA_END=2533 /DNA_ORIENTATION=+